MSTFRPNFDLNATEGDVNDEVEFAIKSPAGPFGFGSAVQLDDTQVSDDHDGNKLTILLFLMVAMMMMTMMMMMMVVAMTNIFMSIMSSY